MPRHADTDEDDWDGEETIPCPYCQRPIHEDAVQCPYCEQYISNEDAPPRPKPWWVVGGVLLCLLVVLLWILSG